MSALPLWYPQQLALIWLALGSLNATMSISYVSRLMSLPRNSTPLLKLQIERLRLNANKMSQPQQSEHNVLLLRKR